MISVLINKKLGGDGLFSKRIVLKEHFYLNFVLAIHFNGLYFMRF
jgi:hypothetical protein